MTILRTILVVSMTLALCGEVIDRIAVSVGNQVITTDQIDDEIRIVAFLNQSEPVLNGEERKKAANRLIEQTLIRREMDFIHYPLPALAEADPLMKRAEAAYSDRQAFLNALAHYSISEDELRQHLWWQLTLLKFTGERFRPSVQISNAEIRQQYREQVEKWQAQGVKDIPSFQESREAMEKVLTEERVNQLMGLWLSDARLQTDIRFRDRVFQ